MKSLVPEKLSLQQKVARMRDRWRNPLWRNYFYTILMGKALGIALVGVIILLIAVLPALFSSSVHAADVATQPTTQAAAAAVVDPYNAVKPVDHINAMNTLWVLLGAFLVFGMQAGFTMLEAGFCRSRETVNVLVECVFDTCVCGLLHWALGFALMFGEGNAFIGWHMPGDPSKSLIFMSGVNVLSTYGATGIPIVAHYVFQFAFADCASTICSGAMVGRTRFIGDLLYSIEDVRSTWL